jgi:hypothetical protein
MNWRDDEESMRPEELVVHWMTTGSLDYPFAAGGQPGGRAQTSPGLDSAPPKKNRYQGRTNDR